MRQDESVSASLIRRTDLPDSGLVGLTAEINGEQEAIIVDCSVACLKAWLNVCPHQGRALDYAPGKFLLDREQLICAAHGATFRLTDGFCVAGPCRGSHLVPVGVRVGDDGRLTFFRTSDSPPPM